MRVANDLMSGLASLIASSSTSEEFDVSHLPIISVTAKSTKAIPANKTFIPGDVDIADDTVTEVAHGFATGLKVQVSTDTTLPDGLVALTDYYLIVLDADTFQFAASLADAVAGTEIDLIDAGTGIQTVEVDTDLAATVKLQFTNDPAGPSDKTWIDVPDSSTAVSASGAIGFNYPSQGWRAIRASVAVTSGAMSAEVRVNAKGA